MDGGKSNKGRKPAELINLEYTEQPVLMDIWKGQDQS